MALPTLWDSLRELSAAPRATLLLEEEPIGCATLWEELLEEVELEERLTWGAVLLATLPELLWEVPPFTWLLRALLVEELLEEVEPEERLT